MALFPYLLGGPAGGYAWKHRKEIGNFAKEMLLGKDQQLQKLSAMSGHQKRYLNDILSQLKGQDVNLQNQPLFQQGQSYLSGLLQQTPQSYEQFKAPMMREFNEQIMPNIAERFAGVGGLSSSGFQQQATQAGQSLSERLGALRSGMQMQALPEALGYAQAPGRQQLGFGQLALGNKPFGWNIQQPQQGMLQGAGQMLPYLMMALMG